MMLLIKLVKLPLRLIALPAALCLFLCHMACCLIIGVSSIVTNILGSVFIGGAIIEWLTGVDGSLALTTFCVGAFLMAAPHIAAGIAQGIANALYWVLEVITR